MLNKKVVNIKEISNLKKSERIVIKVNNSKDILEADKFFSKNNMRIRGIRAKNSLLNNIKDSSFNYFSLIVDDINNLKKTIKQIKSDKSFIEIIVPVNIFIENKNIFNELPRIQRIILEFKDNSSLNILDELFSEIISKRLYPLTKGIPFCNGQIKHMYELFNKVKTNNKPKECNDCILNSNCSFDNNGFTPKKITDKKKHKDILKFLNENEDFTNRF